MDRMESPTGEKDELGLPVDSEELLHAYDELKLFSAVKLQALARRFLIRSRAVKEIYHRYEKIFDPKRKRFYYYDRVTNKSSWYKPAVLLHRDFPDVAPTYLPEQAVKKIQRLVRRVMATHRVRLRYQAVITTIQDEKGKRQYFNPKSGATYSKLPKFMKGRLDYRQRKKEKKPKKKKSNGDIDSDDSDESDEDEDDEDDDEDLSPEEMIQRRRLRRKYPRSKLQLLIDRAEDNIASTFELNLSNFGAVRISSRIYDLKELKTLNLSYNNLRRVSSNLQYLFKLKSLDVSWNQIHTISGDLSELKKLEELICHHNQLSVYPGRLYRLKTLKRIDFSYNQFTEVPIEIGNLDLLKELGEWEVGFGLLTAVQMLNFSHNLLVEWPGQVERIEGLKELYLDYNQITELIPEISGLTQLKIFTIDHNQLKKLPTEFYLLESLEEFRASYNNLFELPNPFEDVLVASEGEKKEEMEDTNHQSKSENDQVDPSKSPTSNSPGQSSSHSPQFIASPTSPMSPPPEPNLGLLSPQSTISKSRQVGMELNSILSNPSLDSTQTGFTANIKLTYPTYPYELSKLVLLDLSYNQFQHLGNELCICTGLLECNLSHNQLQSISEEAFGRCRRLKKLDLSYNQLTTLPLSLQECRELQSLYLSYNQFVTLPKCLLRCSAKIQSCYLDHNRLIELDPKIITMFYELQHLEVQYNQLKELSILCFSIHKLQYVDLSFNQLQSIPNDIGEAWQQLQYLDISNNQLINLPESIGLLSNSLEICYLHHNQLVILPDSIYQLVKLRQLTLQYNRLTTAPYLLYSLPVLQHCNVSHNDFYYVHDLRKHFLYVRRSPWPSGFKEPLQQMPSMITPNERETINPKAEEVEVKETEDKISDQEVKENMSFNQSKAEKKYREIIYDVPHIRREITYLREYAEEVFRGLPRQEEEFYCRYYQSLAENGTNEGVPVPVTSQESKDEQQYPISDEKTFTIPSEEKKQSVNNCDLFLKWLQKLRIHFNFNVEEIPVPCVSSSEITIDQQQYSGKKGPRKGSSKWDLSHSLSYSYSTISEHDQDTFEDTGNRPPGRSSKLSIDVPSSTTGKPPLGPTATTSTTLEKRSSAGFLRGFLGGGGGATTNQATPSVNTSTSLHALKPEQRSMSKSFSLDTVEEQTEKDRPSSAIVATKSGKSDYLHPSGKIRFQHPKPLQQFFLFHLMAKWQSISWTRSRFFLNHFQTMTNRPLAEYNQDINNPAEYYYDTEKAADSGESDEPKNPKPQRYHYSPHQSLLQQKLALSAKKRLEKKLFGLPDIQSEKRKSSRKEDDHSRRSASIDPEEEEEEAEEDQEERQAQARRQAISYQLFHDIGYFGGADLFPIIEHGLECISLTNILVLLEECQVMKQKAPKSLWKKPPSVIASPSQQPLSPGQLQSPGTITGGGGTAAFSRPMSPNEPLSPQITSPLLMSPSDSQKTGTNQGNKASRFSLFSTSAKQKRRSTDNEKELTKKMTDFQQDLSKLLAATSIEIILTTYMDILKNGHQNKDTDTDNTISNGFIEEILLKYGNYLDPEELLQALIGFHYQQFQIPSFPSSAGMLLSSQYPHTTRKSMTMTDPSSRQNSSTFRGMSTSNDSMSLGPLGVTTISNDVTSSSIGSAPAIGAHRSRSVASFVPLSIQQYEVPTSLSNDNNTQLQSLPGGIASPGTQLPDNTSSLTWMLSTLATRQQKNHLLLDTLPLMALPLSLIHHQEQLIRQRYFSDHFGEANVPLTEAQMKINQKQQKTTNNTNNTSQYTTNKKVTMTPLLKEYLRKQMIKQSLRKSFLLESSLQNTATKTIAHDRQRYLMLTESCYQNDTAGEYSIFSTLMEAYSLVIKTILLHIHTQERMMRLLERQFQHQRLLDEYQEYQRQKSLSVPFQHLQLFSRMELAQRSYYFVPTVLSASKSSQTTTTDPKKNQRIGVERKEDYDDILYDIYLSLNVNLSSQQKKKEQKSNLSISSRRKKMVEEFLTRFYDSISLESLGIMTDPPSSQQETEDKENTTEKTMSSSLPPLLQKQNSLASVTSHLTDISSSTMEQMKPSGPPSLTRMNTMDSALLSHLQGSKGASIFDDLTEMEASEYLDVLEEYTKLWYLYTLQILQNYQEILHYRGFTPQLLLQYYLKRSGSSTSSSSSSSKTKLTKEQYDHSLLLSLIASELQNHDAMAKNQSLFNMKIFGEEKRLNEVLFHYRIMIHQLGQVYQGLGMYASALDAYYQYIQLCKGMALTKDFYLNMIKLFLTMGNFYKAHELIQFVIKHFIANTKGTAAKSTSSNRNPSNRYETAENEEDEDDSIMTDTIHYTPGELLAIDREVAILYYYILSQYELFQKTLGVTLDQSVMKLQRQQQHQQSLQHHAYFFNSFISKIPNPSYLYKIQQIEKIIVTQEMSYENIYGRNLLDTKYQQLLQQEQKHQDEQEQQKQVKMAYQNDIHLVKSKALLLLEDEMIANLLK